MAEAEASDLSSIQDSCQAMLGVVDKLEGMDRKIHHLAVDLKSLSETHTEMRDYMASTNSRRRARPDQLEKPFHGLTKLEQFDVFQRIARMRLDLTIKFEALRQVQTAAGKSKAVKKALNLQPSKLSTDPEEEKYLTGIYLY